jgi:hypothetical protein
VSVIWQGGATPRLPGWVITLIVLAGAAGFVATMVAIAAQGGGWR